MAIKAELNYIEFNNTKDKLEPGYYRVTEADGDISIAKVERRSWERNATITWLTEDEYSYKAQQDRELDEQLMESWDQHWCDNRELPMSDEDREYNRRIAIENRGVWEGVDYAAMDVAEWRKLCTELNIPQPPKVLAELLREAMAGNVEFSEPLVGDNVGFAVDTSGLEAEQDEDDIPGTDPRKMSDAQYDELCVVTDQNRRDGMA